MSDAIVQLRERNERAQRHVIDLCDPRKPSVRWTMRVPAEPDRDSDLVLMAALEDGVALLSVAEAARAACSQAAPDEDFEGAYVDELVPHDAMEALRGALAKLEPIHYATIEGGTDQ